ncbi:MAG: carbohydrate porin [Verrucomicrobiota bacterium]
MAVHLHPSAYGQNDTTDASSSTGNPDSGSSAVPDKYKLTPFLEAGFETITAPAVVSMRVSSNLQLIVDQFDYQDPWLQGPFFTGTWGGVREALYDEGVQIAGGYIGNPYGNVSGGTREAFTWHHHVFLGLSLDMEKLIDVEGGSFFAAGRWRGGGVLSEEIGINGLFEPTAFFGSEGWRLNNVFYQQEFLDGDFVVRAGRLIACNEFAVIPITFLFINDALDANIVGISENVPFATGNSAWGMMVWGYPVEDLYIQAGVYHDPPSSGAEYRAGLDFGIDLDRDGYLFLSEIGWDPDDIMGNLPGSYVLGGYLYGSETLVNFNTGNSIDSTWGIYGYATQMVYSETETVDQQGLSLFVSASGAPSDENPLDFYLSAGAVYVGLIPGRETDQFGVALAYANYSDDFDAFTRATTGGAGFGQQTVIEVTYAIGITPWFVIQPDFQYFFDPASNGTVPDTAVIGGQVAIAF